MTRFRFILVFSAVLMSLASVGSAQDLRAIARINHDLTSISETAQSVVINLSLSQPVPFRPDIRFDPNQIIIAFREVIFEPKITQLDRPDIVSDISFGQVLSGWSQLVIAFEQPLALNSADMQIDEQTGTATLEIKLRPATQEDIANAGSRNTSTQTTPIVTAEKFGPLVVVLDPGHGGVDPGAQAGDMKEADLMLTFARELREVLIRSGYDVLLTRTDDSFVSLPARVSIARAAGADVFISLHADALLEGRALGTSVYTLSETASDAASAALAERQDRSDLLAGVDLSEQDDQIATVLMDLARRETKPRTDALADAIITGLEKNDISLYKRPKSEAGFSVLKAPDIPSVLIELGFLSSKTDLEKINDTEWRFRFAQAISDALDVWAFEDAARAERLRK